jgi:A/G-specific adenine glycosylase
MTITCQLIDWYLVNQRDLPWRKTNDPYKIWISEVILQQTRVNQGESYYLRFIDRFPDVCTLANASTEEVLKLWQGLGYYSRARNLHHASQVICSGFKGMFPSEYSEILSLKGIGESTAAAISSIAFGQVYPVTDGNVQRVVARLYGIFKDTSRSEGLSVVKSKANELISNTQPGLFNQAIMDFGAICCTPVNPLCGSCPFMHTCFAFLNNCTGSLPLKKTAVKVRERFFNYLDIRFRENVYLHKRMAKDIWLGMYEFPLVETSVNMDPADLYLTEDWKKIFLGCEYEIQYVTLPVRHQLSHQLIHTRFFRILIKNREPSALAPYIKTGESTINGFAVSLLMDIYINGKYNS